MIITLCGSARFEAWYHAWNEALCLSGHCVFGLASYPSMHEGEREWYSKDQKRRLDAIHKVKISNSNAVLILNVFAYMGESTLSEIEWARILDKPVYFLESWGLGLGIGVCEKASARASAVERFGLPPDFGSPIDTSCSSGNRSVWDLLGPAGSDRSAIGDMLQRRLDPLKGR